MIRLMLFSILLGPADIHPAVNDSPPPIRTRYDMEVTGEVTPALVRRAMLESCEILERISEHKCPPLLGRPALVVLSAKLGDDLWGLYVRNGGTLYLNDKLVGPHYGTFAHGVMIHEIVHWALFWTQAPISKCDNEGLAWQVFNVYVTEQGRPDLANDDWSAGYPLCRAK